MASSLVSMKVFNSLNCDDCKRPFCSTLIAYQLSCGSMICGDCVNIGVNGHECQSNHSCFSSSKLPAYFINDLIIPSTLILTPNKKGYILTKDFKVPDCRICFEEFSASIESQLPMILSCNHSICRGCFWKMRKPIFSALPSIFFHLSCPFCKVRGEYDDESHHNRLIQFLQELPEMEKQMTLFESLKTPLPLAEAINHSICESCNKESSIDQLFACDDCNVQLCGACTLLKHQSHQWKQVPSQEIEKISRSCQKAIECEISKIESELNDLHNGITEKLKLVKEKLLFGASQIEYTREVDNALISREECRNQLELLDPVFKDLRVESWKIYFNLRKMLNTIASD